jgi:hypothetical protein
VKYANDFVLRVKEGSVLQEIFNTITEVERWFEIEMNMENVGKMSPKENIQSRGKNKK